MCANVGENFEDQTLKSMFGGKFITFDCEEIFERNSDLGFSDVFKSALGALARLAHSNA